MRIMTRYQLFELMERSNATTFDEKLQFMVHELLSQYEGDSQNIADVKQKLSVIKHLFKQRWSAARNTKARFLEKNNEWLNGCISLPKAGKI